MNEAHPVVIKVEDALRSPSRREGVKHSEDWSGVFKITEALQRRGSILQLEKLKLS